MEQEFSSVLLLKIKSAAPLTTTPLPDCLLRMPFGCRRLSSKISLALPLRAVHSQSFDNIYETKLVLLQMSFIHQSQMTSMLWRKSIGWWFPIMFRLFSTLIYCHHHISSSQSVVSQFKSLDQIVGKIESGIIAVKIKEGIIIHNKKGGPFK